MCVYRVPTTCYSNYRPQCVLYHNRYNRVIFVIVVISPDPVARVQTRWKTTPLYIIRVSARNIRMHRGRFNNNYPPARTVGTPCPGLVMYACVHLHNSIIDDWRDVLADRKLGMFSNGKSTGNRFGWNGKKKKQEKITSRCLNMSDTHILLYYNIYLPVNS